MTISRRDFLRTAGAAAITPLPPAKIMSAVAGDVVKTSLSRFALTSVGARILPFFDSGLFFGDSSHAIYSGIISNDEVFMADLVDLPAILNQNFNVPEYIDDTSTPFCVGHILAEENTVLFAEKMRLGSSDKAGRSFGKFSSADLRNNLSMFIDNHAGIQSLEELADMSMREFYERICFPTLKKKLDAVMSDIGKLSVDDYELVSDLMEDISQNNLDNLRRVYPEYQDKLDDILRYNAVKKMRETYGSSYPPGYFRLERQQYGHYKMTSPCVL